MLQDKLPENLHSLAASNYFCNVCEFIGIGENRSVDNLQAGKVKRDFKKVEDWFQSLDDAGRARIVRYLTAEWKSNQAAKRFCQPKVK